jgi:hypothetical protein
MSDLSRRNKVSVHAVDESDDELFAEVTHSGRAKWIFFGLSFIGEKSGTKPDAFPIITIVPLRRIISKLLSHLKTIREFPFSVKGVVHVRSLANAIVDAMHTLSICNLCNPLDQIFFCVDNHEFSTVLFRELRLLFGRNASDDMYPSSVEELTEVQP